MAFDQLIVAGNISASGMSADRAWMDVVSNNIANANTTRTPQGGPYKNQVVSFAEVLEGAEKKAGGSVAGNGVKVAAE